MIKQWVKAGFLTGSLAAALACASTAQESNTQERVKAMTEAVNIKGAAGRLSLVVHTPEMEAGKKYPVVIVSHGFMSNKDDFIAKTLSASLQAAGFVAIRYDFNAHGSSEGKFIDMTVLSEVEDAKAVIAYAKSLPYAGSINLAGHSQGGVVTSLVAGALADEIASVVLFAPAAVLVDDAKNGTVMGNRYDPVNVPEYVSVFGHQLGRKYILQAQKLDIYADAAAFKGPACIIHGTKDPVVPYSYAQRYNEIWPGSELYLLEGAGHGLEPDTLKAIEIAVGFLVKQNI